MRFPLDFVSLVVAVIWAAVLAGSVYMAINVPPVSIPMAAVGVLALVLMADACRDLARSLFTAER